MEEGAGSNLKVLLAGAEEEGCPAAGDVGHCGHEQERGVVGEHVVKQAQPLVSCEHLGEQGLQQGPYVQLVWGWRRWGQGEVDGTWEKYKMLSTYPLCNAAGFNFIFYIITAQ